MYGTVGINHMKKVNWYAVTYEWPLANKNQLNGGNKIKKLKNLVFEFDFKVLNVNTINKIIKKIGDIVKLTNTEKTWNKLKSLILLKK